MNDTPQAAAPVALQPVCSESGSEVKCTCRYVETSIGIARKVDPECGFPPHKFYMHLHGGLQNEKGQA